MTRDELIEELKKLPNADVYVEIHSNASGGPKDMDGKVTGVRNTPNIVIEAEERWM